MPKARAPNAPCVAVWLSPADNRLARLRRAELRTDHMHDAALLAAEAQQVDAELATVLLHFAHLAPGGFDLDRHAAEHFSGIGWR
jgi:hypothetical protein